jgi:hypothetical protein
MFSQLFSKLSKKNVVQQHFEVEFCLQFSGFKHKKSPTLKLFKNGGRKQK